MSSVFDPVPIFDEGYQAAVVGVLEYTSPYPLGSVFRKLWIDGYKFGVNSRPAGEILMEPLFKV